MAARSILEAGRCDRVTLLDLPTTAARVERIEYVRRGLWALAEERVDDLPLSGPSTVWLERMRAALVDPDVTQASLRELQRAFGDFLMTLSPLDAGELNRRVREFDETKWAIVEATG
jgi:hypothetical protein